MNDTLDALQVETRLRPDDDTPRLVLADWLEENGDEADLARAELIRIQCQLSQLRARNRTDRDLEWRERSLWWRHVETWLGPIYDASTAFRFQRGLVAVDLDADRLNDTDLDDLFTSAAWAWVERLNLTNPSGSLLACLLHSPAVSRLRCLHLEGGEDLWGTDLRLEECTELSLLQELAVRHTAMEDRGAGLLSACPSLTGLVRLDLGHNLLVAQQLEVMGHAEALTSLTSLELIHNPVGYDRRETALQALRNFLGSPLARRLLRLGMAETALGRSGAELLASSLALASLVELDLSANSIDDIAVETLANAPGLGRLKRLELANNEIDTPGVLALTRSQRLAGLEWLDLSGNALSTFALQALVQAPGWWSLRKLRLGRQSVSHRQLNELRARYGSALQLS